MSSSLAAMTVTSAALPGDVSVETSATTTAQETGGSAFFFSENPASSTSRYTLEIPLSTSTTSNSGEIPSTGISTTSNAGGILSASTSTFSANFGQTSSTGSSTTNSLSFVGATSTPTPSSGSAKSAKSLIGGLAVGISIGVVMITLGLFLLFRLYRKNYRDAEKKAERQAWQLWHEEQREREERFLSDTKYTPSASRRYSKGEFEFDSARETGSPSLKSQAERSTPALARGKSKGPRSVAYSLAPNDSVSEAAFLQNPDRPPVSELGTIIESSFVGTEFTPNLGTKTHPGVMPAAVKFQPQLSAADMHDVEFNHKPRLSESNEVTSKLGRMKLWAHRLRFGGKEKQAKPLARYTDSKVPMPLARHPIQRKSSSSIAEKTHSNSEITIESNSNNANSAPPPAGVPLSPQAHSSPNSSTLDSASSQNTRARALASSITTAEPFAPNYNARQGKLNLSNNQGLPVARQSRHLTHNLYSDEARAMITAQTPSNHSSVDASYARVPSQAPSTHPDALASSGAWQDVRPPHPPSPHRQLQSTSTPLRSRTSLNLMTPTPYRPRHRSETGSTSLITNDQTGRILKLYTDESGSSAEYDPGTGALIRQGGEKPTTAERVDAHGRRWPVTDEELRIRRELREVFEGSSIYSAKDDDVRS